VIYNCDIYIYI
jgi:hypothetical protein